MQSSRGTDAISWHTPSVALLNLVYTSTPNCSPTACEWFANQMRVCVDRTVNLRCTIRKLFAYCLLQTEICRFFVRTKRELDAPVVLCSPQVCRKLINHVPNMCHTRMVQHINSTLVYTRFYSDNVRELL